MTFSPGDVVRLKCGGPAMVIERRTYAATSNLLCVWIVHTMVAREYFDDVVLERVNISKSMKDTALDMWAAGADTRDIVEASGYANPESVKAVIGLARQRGDARAVLREPGRKRKAPIQPAEPPEDPMYRMEP